MKIYFVVIFMLLGIFMFILVFEFANFHKVLIGKIVSTRDESEESFVVILDHSEIIKEYIQNKIIFMIFIIINLFVLVKVQASKLCDKEEEICRLKSNQL